MDATADQLNAIKEHFEAGVELTDEELDIVADASIEVVRDILKLFGEANCTIDEYEGDEGELILDVSDGDLAVLIGRHGKTLDALQVLVSSLVNNKLGFPYPVVVDIEGYKNRRRQKIQTIAHNAASRARKQHGSVKLPPMNAYERRIAHMALASDSSVTTHSEGVDPDRYVIVTAV